jgi:hypothetical protein
MSVLAEQQQALVRALVGPCDDTSLAALPLQDAPLRLRGLQAYRGNAQALAQRALAAAFPVTLQLLGEENFSALAVAFWQSHPPQRGDMGCWGDALPGFMAGAAQLKDEPYLADVGRVEWALHRASSAADVVPDQASLRVLLETDPGDVRLVLASGVALVRSSFPVASIVNAHLVGKPGLAEAGARLREGMQETALVWRPGFKPCVRHEEPASADFIAALQAAPSLGAALEMAAPPEFAQWLAQAVQTGLVAGARAIENLTIKP